LQRAQVIACKPPATAFPPSTLAYRLKLVTERAIIAPLEAALLALALAGLDQMLQAPGTLHRLLTALRAPLVSLHAQLILALPGDWQIRELVFDAFSHFCSVSNRHLQLSGFVFTII